MLGHAVCAATGEAEDEMGDEVPFKMLDTGEDNSEDEEVDIDDKDDGDDCGNDTGDDCEFNVFMSESSREYV